MLTSRSVLWTDVNQAGEDIYLNRTFDTTAVPSTEEICAIRAAVKMSS
jgi:hypothetical protein